MTTLNGLPRYWEDFILGICSRRKLTKFRKIWEECVQEEEIILGREVKLNDNEDQALITHALYKRILLVGKGFGVSELRSVAAEGWHNKH